VPFDRGAAGGKPKLPRVEVDLVRINPIGSRMDADLDTVVSVPREMKAAGKGVMGIKRHRQDEAIKYALSLGVLDAFTIGSENKAEQQDLVRRIAAAQRKKDVGTDSAAVPTRAVKVTVLGSTIPCRSSCDADRSVDASCASRRCCGGLRHSYRGSHDRCRAPLLRGKP
jgi:hypothetical protein